MSSEIYQKIRNNPKFADTVAKRSRFSWTLSFIVLAIFYTFILVVAFAPKVLATPLWAGSATTIGVPIGAGMILFFWLLTGYYIRRANTEFDVTNVEIVKEALK
jgi:cation/acetate symporter